MKTIAATYNSDVLIVDTETANIEPLDVQRNACNRVYMAPEDMHFKFIDRDRSVEEFDVKAGDIILAFWDTDFPHKYIKITSSEWKENLDNYNKRMKELKTINDEVNEAC